MHNMNQILKNIYSHQSNHIPENQAPLVYVQDDISTVQKPHQQKQNQDVKTVEDAFWNAILDFVFHLSFSFTKAKSV